MSSFSLMNDVSHHGDSSGMGRCHRRRDDGCQGDRHERPGFQALAHSRQEHDSSRREFARESHRRATATAACHRQFLSRVYHLEQPCVGTARFVLSSLICFVMLPAFVFFPGTCLFFPRYLFWLEGCSFSYSKHFPRRTYMCRFTMKCFVVARLLRFGVFHFKHCYTCIPKYLVYVRSFGLFSIQEASLCWE